MDVLRLPARTARQLRSRVERASTTALDSLRRGPRTVIVTPPGLRWGNWLYLWLSAHQRTLAGEPTFVMEVPDMRPWLGVFRPLREFTVARRLMRFQDRRERSAGPYLRQRFGTDFTRESLDAFILECLAPDIDADRSGVWVVNVRRGDFYSDPGLRDKHGFDQVGYIRDALARVGHIERALVVSDDPGWCKENLLDVIEANSDAVDFARHEPVSNFKAVASASRIVGTNSTFSYWAAYVSGVIHESPVILMPRFHARMAHGSDAYQLDPRWIAIDGYW